MDFVSAQLQDGHLFRILTVLDQFTRECVALSADTSMSGAKVAFVLSQATVERRATPDSITMENGSEFNSKALDGWAVPRSVQLDFIRPCRPVENGYIESLNGRLRDDCLNIELVFSLADARQKLAAWREDYNHQRFPAETPTAFAQLHHAKPVEGRQKPSSFAPSPIHMAGPRSKSRVR